MSPVPVPVSNWRLYSRFGGVSFLAFVLLIPMVGFTLAGFAKIIAVYLSIAYTAWFELFMVSGQILFQWAVLFRSSWRDRLDYAWILILVSSLGAVLLWPLLAWHCQSAVAPLTGLAYFSCVVLAIFGAHAWVVHRTKLPIYLCASWVVYRIGILLVAVEY
jgi:hypothetical protein